MGEPYTYLFLIRFTLELVYHASPNPTKRYFEIAYDNVFGTIDL